MSHDPVMMLAHNNEFHNLICFWWHQIILQIKETAERILVVDRAAAMIEEMLRPGSQSISPASSSGLANGTKVHIHPLLAYVYCCNVRC